MKFISNQTGRLFNTKLIICAYVSRRETPKFEIRIKCVDCSKADDYYIYSSYDTLEDADEGLNQLLLELNE